METNSSVSYIMPNLLLGLCKGARSLKAASEIFHNQLGYDFFRLELSFLISIGRNINPDAIVVSTRVGNTLLFEWTEGNDPTQKQDQFNRYAKIKAGDLTNIAAVPPAAVKTYDVVLALRRSAVAAFQQQIINNGHAFPILALDTREDEISLIKTDHSFSVPQTDEFFSTGIHTNRIPRYLPFSLESCQAKEIAPFVIQHLVSLLVKGETEITLREICRGFIPAWEWIGVEKQRELSAVTKGIINNLTRKKWSTQLIERIGDNPPTWKLSPDLFKKNLKGFRKQLNEFIAEVRGENYQPGFDFGSEA